MRLSKKSRQISEEESRYINFIAYDALIDFGEKSLPVFPEFDRVIDSTIFILPMRTAAKMGGHEEDWYAVGGDGIVMYVSATGHYIILYDDQLPNPDIRWTISKMIYLIKSGTSEDQPNTFCRSDSDDVDKYNTFAYQFTCPDIVLNECDISEASDIIKYCKIPFAHANIKSRLLKIAVKIKSLKLLEETLKENFRQYIKLMSKHKQHYKEM